MTKFEPGYLLTKLGRKQGYTGLLKEDEIDDSVRGIFTVLRESIFEDIPVLATYIQARLKGQINPADLQRALKKLIRVGLVSEVN